MKKILLTCIAVACSLVAVAEELLIEAESFSQRGGWVLDQQFMDQMGSPYLMAHGMGIPVADATAEINIPQAGTYYVYARTYNWTSPWTDAEGPGKFRLALGGKLLKATLGHTGNSWQWQFAGKTVLKAGTTILALKDLTGFDGRCDLPYDRCEHAARYLGCGRDSRTSCPLATTTDGARSSIRLCGSRRGNSRNVCCRICCPVRL